MLVSFSTYIVVTKLVDFLKDVFATSRRLAVMFGGILENLVLCLVSLGSLHKVPVVKTTGLGGH